MTVAEHCEVAPVCTEPERQEADTEVMVAVEAVMVTDAEPDLAVLAVLVAVMVTGLVVGTVVGAV